MSAFVVSAECMHRVVRAICYRDKYGHIVRLFDGIGTDTADAETRIGRRLFAMNIESVMQRYPDTRENPDNLPGDVGTAATMAETYTYRRDKKVTTARAMLCEAVMAMQCLEYQSCEGNVSETALYRELEKATGTVAQAVVKLLPEYDAAPYG